jgi:hypothetical protein
MYYCICCALSSIDCVGLCPIVLISFLFVFNFHVKILISHVRVNIGYLLWSLIINEHHIYIICMDMEVILVNH